MTVFIFQQCESNSKYEAWNNTLLKEKWNHLEESSQLKHSLKPCTILNVNAGTYGYLPIPYVSTSEMYFPNSVPWIGIKALVHWLLSNPASEKQTFFTHLSVYFSSATLPSTGYDMTKFYHSFKVLFTIKTRNHLGWKYMCPNSVLFDYPVRHCYLANYLIISQLTTLPAKNALYRLCHSFFIFENCIRDLLKVCTMIMLRSWKKS